MFTPTLDNEIAKQLSYFELLGDGTMCLIDGRVTLGATIDLPAASSLGSNRLAELERGFRYIACGIVPSGGVLNWHVVVRKGRGELIEQFEARLESEHPLIRDWSKAVSRQLSERMTRGEILEWTSFLTITFGQKRLGVANPNLLSLVASKVFKGLAQRTHVARSPEDFRQNVLKQATEIREGLLKNLGRLGLNPKIMDKNAVFAAIRGYSTPGRIEILETYQRPRAGYYSEEEYRKNPKIGVATLRSQAVESKITNIAWDHLKIGSYYAKFMALCDYPESSPMNALGELMNAVADEPGEAHLMIQLVNLDRERTEIGLNSTYQNLDSIVMDSPIVDPAMIARRDNMKQLLERSEANNEGYCSVAGILMLTDLNKKRLDDRMAAFKRSNGAIPGRPFQILKTGVWKPFIEAMPFSGAILSAGKDYLESQAVAQLPLNGAWKSGHDPQLIFRTAKGTLLPIALRGQHVNAYNQVIVGETGGGKSYTAQVMMSFLMRYQKTRINIVDIGGSYHILTKMFAPESMAIRVAPDSETRFNPFDLEAGMVKPDQEKISFLSNLFFVRFRDLDGTRRGRARTLIEQAIIRTYDAATRTINGVPRLIMQDCTLSEFRRSMLNMRQIGKTPMQKDDLILAQELAVMLESWCGDKPIGRLIDGVSTAEIGTARMTYFDLSAIGTKNLEMSTVAVTVVNDFIQNRMNPRFETYTFLDDIDDIIQKLPEMKDLINDGFRRGRKLNTSTILITQLWEDLPSEVKDLSFFFWIVSANQSATAVANHVKLPTETAHTMQHLKPGEVFLIVREKQGTKAEVIKIEAHPQLHWSITTHPEETPLREDTIKRFAGNIPKAIKWLSENHAI